MWESLPLEINNTNSLSEFKRQTKHRKPFGFPGSSIKFVLNQIAYLRALSRDVLVKTSS